MEPSLAIYLRWKPRMVMEKCFITKSSNKNEQKREVLEASERTEGLVDGQVGLDDEHGSSGGLGLLEDVATATVEDTIDASDSVLGTLKEKQQN